MRLGVAAALLIAGSAASAQPSLVAGYRDLTKLFVGACSAEFRTWQERIASGDSPAEAFRDGNGTAGHGNWKACVSQSTATTNNMFEALDDYAKKKGPREALKAYRASVLSALQTIEPSPGESRAEYAHRQSSATEKMNDAWARVQVEF